MVFVASLSCSSIYVPGRDLRGLLIVEAHQPPGNIDPWPMQCLVIVAGGLPVNALAAPQDLRHISIARSLCRPLFKSGQLAPGALYHAPVLTQQTADLPEPQDDKR